jgi:hypothetical protein
MSATNTVNSSLELNQVTPEQWKRLEARRIFFGHQSVGGNLIQGVQEVLAGSARVLRVIDTADPGLMTEPGLYHARIGRNGAPSTKLEAFVSIAGGMRGSGTAVLKYCYVDVTRDTDAAALFEGYRAGVEALKASRPGITVLHVTLPLLADRGALRHAAAVVRGKPTYREVNLIREQYNDRVRQTYGGREPIFDLAGLESTKRDGSRATVRYRGKAVPVLAAEWTYDGGHLNEAGRQRMAGFFLATLASL